MPATVHLWKRCRLSREPPFSTSRRATPVPPPLCKHVSDGKWSTPLCLCEGDLVMSPLGDTSELKMAGNVDPVLVGFFTCMSHLGEQKLISIQYDLRNVTSPPRASVTATVLAGQWCTVKNETWHYLLQYGRRTVPITTPGKLKSDEETSKQTRGPHVELLPLPHDFAANLRSASSGSRADCGSLQRKRGASKVYGCAGHVSTEGSLNVAIKRVMMQQA